MRESTQASVASCCVRGVRCVVFLDSEFVTATRTRREVGGRMPTSVRADPSAPAGQDDGRPEFIATRADGVGRRSPHASQAGVDSFLADRRGHRRPTWCHGEPATVPTRAEPMMLRFCPRDEERRFRTQLSASGATPGVHEQASREMVHGANAGNKSPSALAMIH
jgi:hypothetical protein